MNNAQATAVATSEVMPREVARNWALLMGYPQQAQDQLLLWFALTGNSGASELTCRLVMGF